MSEYSGLAGRLADELKMREDDFGAAIDVERGLSIEELGSILGSAGRINLYPGVPGGSCQDLAVFVSLTAKAYKGRQKGHLTCRKAIERLVQHMQGSCPDTTRKAVLIVDNWDSEAAREWRPNLKRIGSTAQLEIYMIVDGTVSPIQI